MLYTLLVNINGYVPFIIYMLDSIVRWVFVVDLGTSDGVMVSKVDSQTYTSEFDSH